MLQARLTVFQKAAFSRNLWERCHPIITCLTIYLSPHERHQPKKKQPKIAKSFRQFDAKKIQDNRQSNC